MASGDRAVTTNVSSSAPAAGSTWDRAAELCTRWLDGDERALDDLVRLLTPVMWQVARACSLSEAEAEDVVQSTWTALVRHRGRLRDPRAVGGWLTTTTRREAWRVAGSRGRSLAVDDEALERVAPRVRSAEAAAVEHDEGDRLWSAVQQLGRRCQVLLRVIAFADRPDYSGIAEELGMPIGSIGPTRMRCLRKLRVLLEEADDR